MPLDYIRLPRLLFPAPEVSLSRFAVIACDQFTADPSFWARTERLVGDAPSCLRLTLPEVYLPEEGASRVSAVHRAMETYLQNGTLRALPEGLMLVERDTGRGAPRRGVLLAFDLDAYDETPGAGTPIRPTEATVQERVPPRLSIRENAPFELPHILLFLDDPAQTVLEPLFAAKHSRVPLYDFALMQGGGHITGRFTTPDADTDAFFRRLAAHAAPEACCARYHLPAGAPPFVLATGDGNHSMAAAKAHWERIKPGLSPAARQVHPARFVLAELVNLWDESICFEAVHRLLLQVDPADAVRFLERYFAASGATGSQTLSFPFRCQGQSGRLAVRAPLDTLPVSLLQDALDAYLRTRPDAVIDFIHGTDTLLGLADAPGRLGFLLPDFEKQALYPYVLRQGVLPRKTFSMGTALEKRYYLEGRMLR